METSLLLLRKKDIVLKIQNLKYKKRQEITNKNLPALFLDEQPFEQTDRSAETPPLKLRQVPASCAEAWVGSSDILKPSDKSLREDAPSFSNGLATTQPDHKSAFRQTDYSSPRNSAMFFIYSRIGSFCVQACSHSPH